MVSVTSPVIIQVRGRSARSRGSPALKPGLPGNRSGSHCWHRVMTAKAMPEPLRFQDDLDDLANRAPASRGRVTR